MKIAFTLLLLAIGSGSFGQDAFHRTYGGEGNDYGRALVVCEDGGYLVVGTTNSFFDPSTDIYILRLNESGDYLWGRNLGTEGSIEAGVDVCQTSDGGFLIAGHTNNTENLSYDGLVMKVSASGDLLWTKNFGDEDWDFLEGIGTFSNGSIGAVGRTTRNGHMLGWVLILDENGLQINESFVESTESVQLTGMDVCQSDTLVFAGYTTHPDSDAHIYLAGIAGNDGEIIWSEEYPDQGDVLPGRCLCSEQQEAVVSVGSYMEDGLLHRVMNGVRALNGEELWQTVKYYTENSTGRGIAENLDGNLCIVGTIDEIISAGFSGSDGVGYVFDGQGNNINSNFHDVFGGNGEDILFDVEFLDDGGYVACGHSSSFGNNFQVLLVRVDSEGNNTLNNQDYTDIFTNNQTNISLGSEFRIYPNPAQSILTVQVEIGNKADLFAEIFTSRGILIYSLKIPRKNSDLDISELPPGVYFVRLSSPEGYHFTEKFVKLDY